MAFYDRAWMSVASTGTGPVTLATAVVGFRTFAAAGVPDGGSVSYTIIDGTTWETGHGTYSATGPTLSRAPLATSAGGINPVAISASATVFLDILAADFNAIALLSGSAAFAGALSAPSLTLTGGMSVTGQVNCNAIFAGQTITGAGLVSTGAISGTAVAVTSHNVYGGNETYAGVYSVAIQDDINGPGWAIGLTGIAVVGANNPGQTTGRTWGVYGGAPSTNGFGQIVQVGVMAHSAVGYAYAAFNPARNGYVFLVNGQSGHVTPGTTDNVATIGTASNRYSTVFAGTGTINTSDKTLKTVRPATATDQERAWAKSIAVVAYQFNDAIAEKGADGARMHWGVLAQDVYQAGLDAGIAEPLHYAFLCRDPLTVHRQETEMVPTRVPAMETVQEAQTTIEMIDGRAVQRVVMVSVERQIIDSFPVFDEGGNPLTRIAEPLGAGIPSDPEIRVPIMHDVPRLIDSMVEVARDITEPVLDDQGAQVMRWGVRYIELVMFLLACGAT